MSKAVLLLILTTLLCSAAAAHFWLALDRSEHRVAALQAQLATLARATQRTPPRTPDVAPSLATTPAPVSPPASTTPFAAPETQRGRATVAAANPIAPARAAAFREQTRQLFKNPEYRAAALAQYKLSIARNYSDLGAALRLSPEQLDAFFSLLAEQQLTTAEELRFSSNMTMTPGAAPDAAATEALQRRAQEAQRRKEAEIRSLLGDAKLQEWNEYQASLPARHQVRQLRTLLQDTATPLQSEQIPTLVSAIAAEQRKLVESQTVQRPIADALGQMDPLASMEQGLEKTQAYHQRLRDVAGAYLTPEQSKRFEQMLDEQLAIQRQSLAMMRAQAQAEQGAGVESPAGSNRDLVILSPTGTVVPMFNTPSAKQ